MSPGHVRARFCGLRQGFWNLSYLQTKSVNSLTVSACVFVFLNITVTRVKKQVGRGSTGEGALVGSDRDSDRSCGHGDEGEGSELASTVVWNQERGIVIIGV